MSLRLRVNPFAFDLKKKLEIKKIYEISINKTAYDAHICSFFTQNTNQKYEVSTIRELYRDLGVLNIANINTINFLIFSQFRKSVHNVQDIVTANLVIKDLIHLNKA